MEAVPNLARQDGWHPARPPYPDCGHDHNYAGKQQRRQLRPADAELLEQRDIDVRAVIVVIGVGVMHVGSMEPCLVALQVNVQVQAADLHGEQADTG